MKKLGLFALSSAALIGFTSAVMFSSGSPGGYTGSPLDGNTCTNCHAGNPVINSEVLISSNIPSTGYAPGETYTIVVTAPASTSIRYGFEITSETNGSKIGTWTITDSNTRFATAAEDAVTQSSSTDVNTWSADWTAPAAGEGTVTFYAAVNASNSNGGTSGDQIYNSSEAYTENIIAGLSSTSTTSVSVYPNPASNKISVKAQGVKALEIYNLGGSLVKTCAGSSIDIQDLASGLYFVKVTTTDGLLTSSFEKK